MLSLIFASINGPKRGGGKKDVMASREIMNLGHSLSFVKQQTHVTDDADELMQLTKFAVSGHQLQ